MKEDILEQLVEDWLISRNGYFVKHNLRYRPSPNHPDLSGVRHFRQRRHITRSRRSFRNVNDALIEEYQARIIEASDTTLEATDIGRLLQLMKAAGLQFQKA